MTVLAPRVCSTLKNFVGKPVHKNHSKATGVCSEQNNKVWAGGKKAEFKWVQASLSSGWTWEVCTACDGLGWRVFWWQGIFDDSSLLTRALKWILHITLSVSFPVLSTTALDCCPVDTSSSTHSSCHACRTGSEPTAQISLLMWVLIQEQLNSQPAMLYEAKCQWSRPKGRWCQSQFFKALRP